MPQGADATMDCSPAAGSGPARLVVCERTGRWAVALRRELADPAARVRETRSLADAWDVLRQCPASFLVAELTRANADSLLARLTRIERDYPSVRVAVVTERGLRRCEWLMREAGAVHFAVTTRNLAPLARAAARHLETCPPPKPSLAEQVWAELPWGQRDT